MAARKQLRARADGRARSRRSKSRIGVTVVLVNDNYASTALGPIEVFHAAGLLWQSLHHTAADPRFDVTVASVDAKPVNTAYSVGISPQCAIDEIEHTDLIVIPSAGLDLTAHFDGHRAIVPWLEQWHERGAYVAGICTGTAYLAEAGLLDHRQATTHWAVASAYRARYPKVDWREDLLITEDQRLFCGGGVYASMDLSLYLVDKFCGHDVALQCAKSLLLDMPRTHQSGYAVLPLSRPHDDERIRGIEAYMVKHFASDLSIDTLAERASMSPRTFQRRFKAATGRLPGNYLQAQRVAIAKTLLENGSQSIQAVSYAVGYEDVAFFRKLFRRETGMTPGEYRAKFAGIAPQAERVFPPLG